MNERIGMTGYIAVITFALLYCAANVASGIIFAGAAALLMVAYCLGEYAYMEYFEEE